MDWKPYIDQDPQVMVGKPCIKGTRLTVEFILEQLGNGWTIEDLSSNFGLSKEQVQAAQAEADSITVRL